MDGALVIAFTLAPSRADVSLFELGSPLSHDTFLHTAGGAAYGLAHTPARLLNPWLGPRTPVPGLWLTGQVSEYSALVCCNCIITIHSSRPGESCAYSAIGDSCSTNGFPRAPVPRLWLTGQVSD